MKKYCTQRIQSVHHSQTIAGRITGKAFSEAKFTTSDGRRKNQLGSFRAMITKRNYKLKGGTTAMNTRIRIHWFSTALAAALFVCGAVTIAAE
ncbi:MAG: hypothetical protein HY644_07235 [Acidobacteria bacterium]|nr:hypothetical protein [Acidobacteriota bacterium]